jgi:hypothetical protein
MCRVHVVNVKKDMEFLPRYSIMKESTLTPNPSPELGRGEKEENLMKRDTPKYIVQVSIVVKQD